MKNYIQAYNNCALMLEALGYNIGNVISVTVNPRLSRALGRTKKTRGDFYIELSSSIVQDSVPEKALRTVILHELIHTMDGCFNHGPAFSAVCNEVNRKYGYNINTLMDIKKEGVTIVNAQQAKYKIVCNYCGNFTLKKRMCAVVKNAATTRDYICRGCGHRDFRVERL